MGDRDRGDGRRSRRQRLAELELAELEQQRRRGMLAEEEYQVRRARLVHAQRPGDGGVGVLSLVAAGAMIGVPLAALAVVGGEIRGWHAASGVAALLAGLVFAAVYFRWWKWRMIPWALVVVAFWHLASLSWFGVPGATLLFTAGVVSLAGRRW